jgi:hypothetical protein
MKSLTVACVLLLPYAVFAQMISLDCRVQYKKDGDMGHRAVLLVYDQKKLITVKIDDQPVYTFNLAGKTIATSVDSERIQIEFQSHQTVWRSNLRDRDFGTGVCVKIK